MSFDSLTLECFLAVIETGSFTQAAHKVSRTQSAVSQQITKLENYLGHSLFIRGKKLTLTSQGEVLFHYAKKIVNLNREALDKFKYPELQGEVRFGLPEDFATVFLAGVLTDYAALHPLIFLNIECDLTLNLFERFKRKELDLVLLKMSRPKEFPSGIDICSENLVWVGNEEIFELDDKKIVPLVLSPSPCIYRSRGIQALEEIKQKWRVVFSSGSYAGKMAAVKSGMGVTVLPRNMVPDDLEIIDSKEGLPSLQDTHISLLKHEEDNLIINSFEKFIIKHLDS